MKAKQAKLAVEKCQRHLTLFEEGSVQVVVTTKSGCEYSFSQECDVWVESDMLVILGKDKEGNFGNLYYVNCMDIESISTEETDD